MKPNRFTLISSLILATSALAVSPPPDGGYPNGNTAEGEDALFSLTLGINNTGIGFNALFNDIGGHYNTATGFDALYQNTNGGYNTAIGSQALYTNTTGEDNVAIGYNSMSASNTTGSSNTAIGAFSLQFNTTGSNNIAVGNSAGSDLTTGSNNIDIGAKGSAGESNTIRIGKKGTQTTTRIAGISGATVVGGVGVIIDTNGKLGTVTSSARYKDAIQPMNRASEAILSLQPVTFRYKHELDPESIPQFGLVAEQVEKVNPDLVARDDNGKPYTVRYEAVNAMLLNEFLKEHRKVEEQADTIKQQERRLAELERAVSKLQRPKD